tara:strand:- start:1078 stop:4875 length:3798 start_codon:yes stop_codon:yes gene_type:complete
MTTGEGISTCYRKQTFSIELTGLASGDQVRFFCPRYNNTLPFQPDMMAESAKMGWSIPNNQHNQAFIEGLVFRESKFDNYVGQIDQFRVSNEAKYTNIGPTGIYDSGWLNSDLGPRTYVDELNVTKRAAFTVDNGYYSEPTSAPTSGSNTIAILNFDTDIGSSGIVVDGITGDSQHARIFKTYPVSSPATNITFETGETKFGTSCISFPTGDTQPGRDNYLYATGITLGLGDFTAEMWIKPSGNAFESTDVVVTSTTGITGGAVSTNIISGGAGFTETPTVILSGGSHLCIEGVDSCSATGLAVLSGLTISLLSGGAGYTAAPEVIISGETPLDNAIINDNFHYGESGVAEAFIDGGVVTGISMTVTGGLGYYNLPTIIIDGDGTGAAAEITSLGKIVSINVFGNSGFSGYTVAPTGVIISGGGGTGAYAEAVLNFTGLGVTGFTGTTGYGATDSQRKQTLVSFGPTGSGFNFFISGGPMGNVFGIDLYNGGFNSGLESTLIDTRTYLLGGTGTIASSGSPFGMWEDATYSGAPWNHVAFVRHNRDFKAYLDGKFAGMINYTGITPTYGNSNYSISGSEGLRIDNSTVKIGGGSIENIGYEGLMDGFNLVSEAKYTGVFKAPRPYVACDVDNEIVSHFDVPHNSYDFSEAHCCPATGDCRGYALWGETIAVQGAFIWNITGAVVGKNKTPASEWRVTQRDTVYVTIPEGAVSGPVGLMWNMNNPNIPAMGGGVISDQWAVEGGNTYVSGKKTECIIYGCNDLVIGPPPISIGGFTPLSGYEGYNITVTGSALHTATTLMVSGNFNNRISLPFTHLGTTGLNFVIPTPTTPRNVPQSETYIQVFSDTTGVTSTEKLKTLISGIQHFTPSTGVYGDTVIFSGNNFNIGVDTVLFRSYNTGTITSYVPGMNHTYVGNTGIHVQVPNGLIQGIPVISGSGIALTEVISGYTDFTPIPTISGIEITNRLVGCSFRLTGINATNLVPLLAFTGNSLQPHTAGSSGVVEFIANTGDAMAEAANSFPPIEGFGIDRHNTGVYSRFNYFGKFEIDKTHLEANLPTSAHTGYAIITGTLNNQIIGTGNPLLISRYEVFNTGNGYTFDNYYGVSGLDIDLIRQDFVGLKETYALQNISKVTGDQMVISGKVPIMTGVAPIKGGDRSRLRISGFNTLNITGIRFVNTEDTADCHMLTGDFVKDITTITVNNPTTNSTSEKNITGWYMKQVYTGNGEYIDAGNFVQLAEFYPCEEMRIYGSIEIEYMYDSSITMTGDC